MFSKLTDVNIDIQGSRKYIFLQFQIMNQLPENSLRIYDVTFSNIIFNRITLEPDRFLCCPRNQSLFVLLLSLYAYCE